MWELQLGVLRAPREYARQGANDAESLLERCAAGLLGDVTYFVAEAAARGFAGRASRHLGSDEASPVNMAFPFQRV